MSFTNSIIFHNFIFILPIAFDITTEQKGAQFMFSSVPQTQVSLLERAQKAMPAGSRFLDSKNHREVIVDTVKQRGDQIFVAFHEDGESAIEEVSLSEWTRETGGCFGTKPAYIPLG